MDKNESPCMYCSEPTCYYGNCPDMPQPGDAATREHYEQRTLEAFGARRDVALMTGDPSSYNAWSSAYDMLKYLLDDNYGCLEQFLTIAEGAE